jgi:hypothetical protein
MNGALDTTEGTRTLKQPKKNEGQILSENLKKQSADGMMVESQMQQHDHDHFPKEYE